MTQPDASPRRAPKSARRRKILKRVGIGVVVLLLVAATSGFLAYRHLEGNIEVLPIPPAPNRPQRGPEGPLNILVLGSDTRVGQTGVDGAGGDLSDTTILLHLSADRRRAYGVSIPRDLIVRRPECAAKKPGGRPIPAEKLTMFNTAYGLGGPGCTMRTVEAMTHVYLDHVVVVKFDGFKKMVDALGGVPVCVPKEIHDDVHKVYLRAGTYDIFGNDALTYVRARYGIGDGSDVGRIKRQQAFLAAMTNKAVSLGTLVNPPKLYSFLDAVTGSIQTDKALAKLNKLVSLARQLKHIGLDNVNFLTMPIEPYPADTNRLQPARGADALWRRLANDQPLTRAQIAGATSAAGKPAGKPSHPPSSSPTDRAAADERTAEREAVGLCA